MQIWGIITWSVLELEDKLQPGWPDDLVKKAPNFLKMPNMAANLLFTKGFYLVFVA